MQCVSSDQLCLPVNMPRKLLAEFTSNMEKMGALQILLMAYGIYYLAKLLHPVSNFAYFYG